MLPDALHQAIEAERASVTVRKPVSVSTAKAAPTIYLGSAYGRNMEPTHIQSLMRMLRHPVTFAPTWNDALICRARSKTATHFLLETGADVHVSIDSDIVFDPESVMQIAAQAEEYGIVGGLYVTRANGALCRPTSLFEYDQPITFGTDPTPQPVKWLATGFVATARRVFERLAEDLPLCHRSTPNRFYPFYQPFWVPSERDPEDTVYLSEDFAFSERARVAGFQSYINPAIRLLHFGQYPFSLEDLGQPERTPAPLRLTYQQDGRFKYETPTADTPAGE